jgi:2-keto-4-pentenoate hydratase
VTKSWDDPRIVTGMRAQLAARRARIDAGEKPLGWKVGFGAPAAMQLLGITAPLVGYLMQKALLPSGSKVSRAGWTKPLAEPEIAIIMGKDLASGEDRAVTKAAIAAIAPAFELADLERPPTDVTAVLSGNIYQRHVILGPQDTSRAGANLEGLTCRVLRQGMESARTTDPQSSTGEMIGVVGHVADFLTAFGERLRAGDIIITGSVVPPIFVEPNDDLIEFALDPVGQVSVAFTGS